MLGNRRSTHKTFKWRVPLKESVDFAALGLRSEHQARGRDLEVISIKTVTEVVRKSGLSVPVWPCGQRQGICQRNLEIDGETETPPPLVLDSGCVTSTNYLAPWFSQTTEIHIF